MTEGAERLSDLFDATAGEIELRTKSTPPPRKPLHRRRRESKQCYYWISMKPEQSAHHKQVAEGIAKPERNPTLVSSEVDTTHYIKSV